MAASTVSAIAVRPRTTLVSLLVVAFLCGAAAGAIGMRGYAYRKAHTAELAERKEVTLERWRKQLNLTDDQVSEMRAVLDDFYKYYDSVIMEGRYSVLQKLSPEQRKKFEQLSREHF